jgi:hypothetical protein
MNYRDMIIEASDWRRERDPTRRWVGRFQVRVLHSPAGEMAPEAALRVECDYGELQARFKALGEGRLDRNALVGLGRTLALLLLPPATERDSVAPRTLLAESLKQIGPDEGLRLRLRLPHELAGIPWEYVYLDRAGGGGGMDGFVALDPRIALVRHETLSVPASLPLLPGPLRVVAALADAIDLPPLNLDQEEAILTQTLTPQAGFQLDVLHHAGLSGIQAKLPGAAIFHFAGHGLFDSESLSMGVAPGAGGFLVLDDQLVSGEQMALNLRGSGVRLAVLGGCETGRRDVTGMHGVWGSLAAALVKAEIPGVVAYQFAIPDQSALQFCQGFYTALAGGLSLERAMAAGRIAIYNQDPDGWAWGVPVLYLRTAEGQLFAGAADPLTRETHRSGAEALVRVRAGEVAAGGDILGVQVRELTAGSVDVQISVTGTVYGTVTGGEIEQAQGGSVQVEIEADRVGESGKITGLTIDTI